MTARPLAKKTPRPLFRLARVEPAKTYVLLSTDQLGGGATCTINDGTGELLIQSDWGTWAHQWSTDPRHLGAPTLTDFLRAHDRTGYVWDKLHYGRPREEFDQDATIAFLRGKILAGVDDDNVDLLDEEHAELLEELDDLTDPCGYETFLERCSSGLSELLGDRYEDVVMVELNGSTILREMILPSLWAALRASPVER